MSLSRLCRSVAFPALMILAGCATAGHPCFSERVMFPDKSASCQYGRAYHCDNGDWIAHRTACTEAAPELSASATLPGNCQFAGISFTSGSASCHAGTQYRCEDGRWSRLDLPCAVGDAPMPVAARGDACSYGDITVASSTAICQSGTTFLCNNGQWISLGTVCR
jgi:hypothetical protein